MKILIVEDEPKTGDYLKQGLGTEAGLAGGPGARRPGRPASGQHGAL
jgi:hypothetical protein